VNQITWVAVADALQAEVRLYDRLFTEAHPEADGKDFLENLNPDSLEVVTAYVEPSLAKVPAGQRFQFERHGYFVTDLIDHTEGKVVINRVTSMKDTWK
jgi:glutaminyl-tRNA synthetase